MNPPGPWAVAGRDAAPASSHSVDLPFAEGTKGPLDPTNFGFWGIWNFSPNASAAKSLLAYLSTRSSVEKLVAGSHGVDIPSFEKLSDFKTGRRKSRRPARSIINPPRGDLIAFARRTARPASARRCLRKAHLQNGRPMQQQGKSVDAAIDFAQSSSEGSSRT